jgi:4-hydroxybenzoate polyprenyltransferase
MISFFRLIRLGNLFLIALSLSLFYYFILVPAHEYKLFTKLLPFTTIEFVLFVLSVVMVAAGGNIINDYFDFELDRAYKPQRPLPSGAISLDMAMYLHAVFAFAGIAIGFYLGYRANNFKIGYLYVVCVLLLYLYSSYLKKVPLLGNIVVSALAAFIFLLLMVFEAAFLNTIHFDNSRFVMAMLLWQVLFYGGFAFLTNLTREVVKDIEDMEGDAEFNITTFPVQFGEKAARMLVLLLLIITFAFLAFFIKLFLDGHRLPELTYMVLCIWVPLLGIAELWRRAKTSQDYGVIARWMKIVMLLGVLSIPVFYYINKLSA